MSIAQPHQGMKEDKPAPQCGQPIPQIIVLSDMDKFVPQNIIELIAVEVWNQLYGEQDVSSPPVAGGRRTQSRSQAQFTSVDTQLKTKSSKQKL